MYQAARKIHLWVGLLLSLFILIEAITGLLVAEPWLVGQSSPQKSPIGQQQNMQRDRGQAAVTDGVKEQLPSGIIPFAKGLHQGKLGGLNLKWIADLTAIGLVILTLTGIYIALPILRARNKIRL